MNFVQQHSKGFNFMLCFAKIKLLPKDGGCVGKGRERGSVWGVWCVVCVCGGGGRGGGGKGGGF